jgi:hypothetical protein
MATNTPLELVAHPLGKRTIRIWKWTGVNAGDDCRSVVLGAYSDKTVYFHSSGAFGGSLTFEVSPEPDEALARYVTAKNAESAAAIADVSAEAAHTILTHGYRGRPTAGAGVVGVNVYLVLESTR